MFGTLAPGGGNNQMAPLLALINAQNKQRQGGVGPGQFQMPEGGLMAILQGKAQPQGLLAMLQKMSAPGGAPGGPLNLTPPGIVPPTPAVPIPSAGPAGTGFTGGPAGLW